MEAEYLTSSYFKNMYLYLVQNELNSFRAAIRHFEIQADKYLLLY